MARKSTIAARRLSKGLLAALGTLTVLAGAMPANAQSEFQLTPDSFPKAGVPQGRIIQYVHENSKAFPGSRRDVWVYVPANLPAGAKPALLVFQDGGGYADRNGGYRLPTVLDNLIAAGQIPPSVAILVNPGVTPAADNAKQLPRYNRSVEYDGIDARYANFLIDELIPDALKRAGVTVDPNPANHVIGGASSGGIAAFTAAWHRPDYFGKVLGFISSFTDLRGGYGYPSLLRKSEPKPLRLYLQEGTNDQDIYSGSWPIGNQDVVAALRFAGYDMQYVTGPGGHDGRQASAVMPEALRWLFRPDPLPVGGTNGRQPVFQQCLIPGEGWKTVDTPDPVDALATLADGTLVVTGGGNVRRLGDSQALRQGVGPVSHLAAGPDGSLVASLPAKKQVVRWSVDGKEKVLIRGLKAAAVAPHHSGAVYVLEEGNGRIWRIAPDGKRTLEDAGLPGSRAICLVPDQSLLLVAPDPAVGKYGLSLRVGQGGKLVDRQHYHDIAAPYADPGTGASAMAVDSNGWLYIPSRLGIQMLDQAGRVNGIVASPVAGGTGALAFAGEGRNTLYASVGGKLYARRTKAVGAVTSLAPVKPPQPRL